MKQALVVSKNAIKYLPLHSTMLRLEIFNILKLKSTRFRDLSYWLMAWQITVKEARRTKKIDFFYTYIYENKKYFI